MAAAKQGEGKAEWEGDAVEIYLSELIAPCFVQPHRALWSGEVSQLVLKGGRGSGKSSYASIEGLCLLLRHPGMHGMVVRKVGVTLRNSVFAQYQWAADALGMGHLWRATTSPMEMTYIPTGQKLFFCGADDDGKLKSLKPAFGWIGFLHLEELDQFDGPEEVRSIEQSVLRGGPTPKCAGRYRPVQKTGKPADGKKGELCASGHETCVGGSKEKECSLRNGGVQKAAMELEDAAGNADKRQVYNGSAAKKATSYEIKTFNPPRARSSWVNEYCLVEKAGQMIHHSTYLGTPPEWLGERFLADAEHLKTVNPAAYEHEYLGVPNLAGGLVFENVVQREIPDCEIQGFERVYHGVDWGWYPDPWAFNSIAYSPAKRELYVFCEAGANRKSNAETAEIVLGLAGGGVVICDSAEPKSIEDYRAAGVRARAVRKGPGSLAYSYKWLQSLAAVVIDPVRCPKTLREFMGAEYEKDRLGNVLETIPDRDNHHIDAVRYAAQSLWRKRGG